MNQTQTRSLRKKVLSLILAVVMVVSLLPISAFASGDSTSTTASDTEFLRIFHLDCGRKYFNVDQIEDLIDAASDANYTHVELAIGNDGLRFLLKDMSVTVGDKTYTSEEVTAGIQQGNKNYYNAGDKNELTQSEMDEIIDHAKAKNISIIPLLNSPGHMDAIIDCMESLGMSNVAYSGSARTISLTNSNAAAFTKALIEKYVKYFASKGCKYFNMGADEYANDVSNGFAELISNNTYGNFVTYVNDIAGIIETAGMTPIAFNDGIYYNSNTNFGTFDKKIVISYWTSGWNGYTPASAYFLAQEMNHKIINTNDKWYYVLGRAAGNKSGYTIATAQNGVENVDVTTVPGGTISNPSGCMLAFWCDSPSAQYSDTEAENVKGLISALASNNKDYFTTVSPTEPEILTSTGSTTLDVNGGSTTLSVSDGAEATWTVDPADGSVIKLISASNADGDLITGSRVEAVATGKGTATITATVGTKTYTMQLTVADPNEVPVEVPAGGEWTTTVKDVDLRNQVGEYDESAAKVKVSYDKKDGGITVTPVTSVSYGTAYYIQSSGKYLDKDANWVADSTSAAEWTWSGSYLSCNNSYLYYSDYSGWTTTGYYGTPLYFNDGTFYRTRSGWTGNYTYSNPLGQPGSGTKADPVNASTITITGVTAGQETTVKIGDVTYRIKVTDEVPSNAMTGNTLTLEYWITNKQGHTSESNSAATSQTIARSDAQTESGVEIKTVAPKNTYSDFTGKWTTLYYWQAVRLDSANNQTTVEGDDETADGTTLTHVRYYNGAWQYKTADNVWHYFLTGDQLVAYYLQRTDVTKEVLTYSKDWGYGTDQSYETPPNGQVALTVAVVYPDGTVSPAEGDMYANSTTIFNYWENRDIGIVAPENNSKYNISKITITDGERTTNTSSNTWTSTDEIEWNKTTNAAGQKWYTETEVWNKSSGTTPMVNGSSKKDLYVWSAKNTAKLVLIYLERVEQTTDLQVVYKDDNAGEIIYSYGVGVKYMQDETAPTFKTALMNATGTVIGGTANWPGKTDKEDGYLPDDAYVTNDSNVNQKFNKVLTKIPDITGVYASGLYEYVGADISEDGKTLTLHYNLKQTEDKTFVVDFGLPIVIPAEDFGIENTATVKSVSFDEKDVNMTERVGKYGKGTIDMDAKTVTYTLTETLDSKIAIPVYVTFTDNTVKILSVYVIPATSVYYEDSFATFTNCDSTTGVSSTDKGKGYWVTDGTTVSDAKQALEELGSKQQTKNVYGYDPAYNNSSTFSMGSATKVTVDENTSSNGQSPTATFTFKGTGFDVISLTGNQSGTVMYTVTNKTTETSFSKIVNTYYGYKYENGKWTTTTSADPNALYQIPVIREVDLEEGYGEYEVTISVLYGKYFNSTANDYYSFWLDAIRVYDPMGKDNDTYKADKEGYPQYIELHDSLVAGTANSAAVFIDGGATAEIRTTYANFGPNNEVYLANSQAISFKITPDTNIASIQIGAKAPDGIANMTVNGTEQEIKTATEMYYTISADDGKFTIVNNGNGILSLTNLKITFNSKPTTPVSLATLTAEDQENAVAQVRALFAAPVQEPFNPDRFDVSWSRNVRKGDTAKLTVKTSEDVEAITVNGETIDSYVEHTERTGWGWWAKTVTYREFTYTITADVTKDFTVCAVNAKGVSSEAKTATLTVRPSVRDWLHGIIGKWF